MARKDSAQTHQKIMATLKEIGSKDACTSVKLLARHVKADPRTVRKHLEVAEIDDIGRFTDSNKTIFCIKRSLDHLFDESERRHSSGEQLVMEGSMGYHSMLVDIKTGKDYKKEMKEDIRKELGKFFENKKFDELKNAPLDLAIHLEVNAQRLSYQDLDNVLKVVLDALQKDDDDPSWIYLYENDSQVYRLQIEKSEKVEISDYNTASIMISFRKHDTLKQIILVPYQGALARKFGFM